MESVERQRARSASCTDFVEHRFRLPLHRLKDLPLDRIGCASDLRPGNFSRPIRSVYRVRTDSHLGKLLHG
jgi:hypothetical protein